MLNLLPYSNMASCYFENENFEEALSCFNKAYEIEKDSNGKYLFHTKGIANLTEDPIVKEEQVYGKIVHEAKLLSLVYSLVAKPLGMFIFVIVPVFYIIGSEFLSFLLERDEEKRKKAKKAKNKKTKEKEKEE